MCIPFKLLILRDNPEFFFSPNKFKNTDIKNSHLITYWWSSWSWKQTQRSIRKEEEQEASKDDDVIDADYEEVDEDKKASGQ